MGEGVWFLGHWLLIIGETRGVAESTEQWLYRSRGMSGRVTVFTHPSCYYFLSVNLMVQKENPTYKYTSGASFLVFMVISIPLALVLALGSGKQPHSGLIIACECYIYIYIFGVGLEGL